MDIKARISYGWDYIKTQTEPVSTNFDISDLDFSSLPQIPLNFLNEYVRGKRIQIGFPDSLPVFYPEEFRFFQNKEFGEFYFFSIIHANEYCCKTMYGITLDKKDLRVINIAVFGLTGGDGGWYENDIGKWNNEYEFEVVEAESFDEDLTDNPEKFVIDTVTAVIKISRIGAFERIVLDSVHYENGIRVIN